MNNIVLLPILNFVKEIYFDEDDDLEENVLEKVDNFAEFTVPYMQDHQFKRHFRMYPETFENLLYKLHTTLIGFPINAGSGGCTVWYLGNLESIRSVADRFGVAKSTCWDILQRSCTLLLQMNTSNRIISWPNRNRQANISENLSINGFPGVVGCIDGSHIISIVAPKQQPNSYVNRKSYHSLLLQGVCDHRMLFIDVYAGEAGSIHDYTLYKRSNLSSLIQRHEVEFFNDGHLIGDLAYKLDVTLIVGFKDNGHLTLRQKNFNVILSKIRVKIENAFCLLKGRFRRLKFMETVRMDFLSQFIVSAAILHNICILNGDATEDILDIEEERRVERESNPHNLRDLDDEHVRNVAIIKRNNILNNLPLILRE